MTRDGQRLSTLDLFGKGFVVLGGEQTAPLLAEAAATGAELGIPVAGYRVNGARGDLHDQGHFGRIYGVEGTGAVLVRPDGYVAWRGPACGHPVGFREILRQAAGLATRRDSSSSRPARSPQDH